MDNYQPLISKTIICIDCDKVVEVDGIVKNKKRCDECQEIYDVERNKIRVKKNIERLGIEKERENQRVNSTFVFQS